MLKPPAAIYESNTTNGTSEHALFLVGLSLLQTNTGVISVLIPNLGIVSIMRATHWAANEPGAHCKGHVSTT